MKHYFNMHKCGMQWLFETREDPHFYFVNCFVSERLKQLAMFCNTTFRQDHSTFSRISQFLPQSSVSVR